MKNKRKVTFASVARPFLFILVLYLAFLVFSGFKKTFYSYTYFSMLFLNTIIISLLMKPDLITERAQIKENVKRDDIFYALMIGRVGPLLLVMICGVDVRFGWTNTLSVSLKITALLILLAGLLLSDWAVIINTFFSGVVRIQRERGHKVIDKGPYRYVRHPGYLGSIVYNLATPLVLNSLVGLIPAILLTGVTVIRTKKEDDYLKKELEGYKEYSEKTKFKIIPYIW